MGATLQFNFMRINSMSIYVYINLYGLIFVIYCSTINKQNKNLNQQSTIGNTIYHLTINIVDSGSLILKFNQTEFHQLEMNTVNTP